MSSERIKIGPKQAYRSASGRRILKYVVEMYHEGLNEHKIISAPEMYMLDNKINQQALKWTKKWELVKSRNKINTEKEANLEEAEERTTEATQKILEINDILNSSLSNTDKVTWDSLKKIDNFLEKTPSMPLPKPKINYPNSPTKEEPVFSLTEKMFKSKKEQKIKLYVDKHSEKIKNWESEKFKIDELNHQLDLNYEKELQEWKKNLLEWEKRKKAFFASQSEFNHKIDQLKEKYFSKDTDSIIELCEAVLNNSKYPESFPNNFELEFNFENKILIIEYELPSPKNMPNTKEVKYIASKKELKEICISDTQMNKMYDDALYKITLRVIHELFETDEIDVLDAISFNGWVKSINRANGKEENNCILSIQVKKTEFSEIDLVNVDPKTCFKTLKGVASSKLSSLTPIQPILQINKFDKRFIEPYEVADQLDASTNLAAMDWEDFEHLIREIFEKEFQKNGGEVKITQASRDGGVDAVAFDPDPIRGGKIVIQAKRYTNVVGVSAVRDLYGTVHNEGATKGILVTTATYGPDAYNFAKGKPLTLLNGSELLYLLEKHGHHARIDLREAREILNEK